MNGLVGLITLGIYSPNTSASHARPNAKPETVNARDRLSSTGDHSPVRVLPGHGGERSPTRRGNDRQAW